MTPTSLIKPSAQALVKIYRLLTSKEQLARSLTDEDSRVRHLLGRPDAVTVVVNATVEVLRDHYANEFPHGRSWEPAKANVEELLRQVQGRPEFLEMASLPGHVIERLMAGGGNGRYQSLGEPDGEMFVLTLTHSVTALCELLKDHADWFVAEAAARLLTNSKNALDMLERIEASLGKPSTPEEDARQWQAYTSAYLNRVRERSSKVEIVGIDLIQVSQPYSLMDAFHHLTLSDGESESKFTETDDLVHPGECLVLVGEPGSGKSTIMKWLATRLAAEHDASNARVPFLVELRQHTVLPELDNIADPFTDGLAPPRPTRWAMDIIETGTGVLLLDGLDEARPDLRARLIPWIADLLKQYGRRGLSVVLTSRPHAVEAIDGAEHDGVFVRYDVQPMGRDDINQFIGVWWKATQSQRRGEKFSSLQQLKQRIIDNPVLVDLARNPLLAAVLCSLYCVRARRTATNRVDLYRDLTDMLLRRRDDDAGIPTLLSLHHSRTIAQKIAMSFVDGYSSTRSLEDVYELGRQIKRVVPALDEYGHKTLIDDVRHRSYLIRALPPDDDVDFWHNSFKEYLAACEINDEHREHDLMTRHATPASAQPTVVEDDAWTEVRHWACAVMGTTPASAVVNWLIDQAGKTDNVHLWRREALICGDFATSIDEPTSERLNALVETMLETEDAGQVIVMQAWRRVGESALRFLTRAISGNRGHDKQAAAARIAAAIGGDEAVQRLAGLPDSVKSDIAPDLLALWRLDPQPETTTSLLGFATTNSPVPAVLRTVNELLAAEGIGSAYSPRVFLASDRELQRVVSAEPIDLRPNSVWARELSFTELVGVLRYTRGADHVRAIDLRSTSTGDHDLRVPVKTLSMAAASDVDLDLSALTVFDGLQRIELTGFSRLTATEVHLPALRHATLTGRDLDLACLSRGLQSLAIDWPESDFEHAPDLPELTSLGLGPDSALTSLDGIERFASLAWLDLSQLREATRIDLTPLELCLTLEEVVLPTWIDLSDVLVPPGLDVKVVADGELFGLPLELQAPLLGLVAERWYEDIHGLSDDEIELRGWDNAIWSDWVDDGRTAQDRRLDVHMTGAPVPVVPGDEDTIGWTITDTNDRATSLQPPAGSVDRHHINDGSPWPDRRAVIRLIAALTDLTDEVAELSGDEGVLRQLLDLVQSTLVALNEPDNDLDDVGAVLAETVNALDVRTCSDVIELAADLDPRWKAILRQN